MNYQSSIVRAERSSADRHTDVCLVRKALQDPEAFTAIYDRYANRVYRFALHATASIEGADETVSDTMLSVYQNLENYDATRGSLTTWVFSIARRRIADQKRKTARTARLLRRMQSLYKPPTQDPVEEFWKREEVRIILRAVTTLNDAEQELIYLRYGAELSCREIAEITERSEGSVRTQLHRLRRRIRSRAEQ